jgi:competence protein ComEC
LSRADVLLYLLFVPAGAFYAVVTWLPARDHVSFFTDKTVRLNVRAGEAKTARALEVFDGERFRSTSGLVALTGVPVQEPGSVLEILGTVETPPELEGFDYPAYLASLGVRQVLRPKEVRVIAVPRGLLPSARRELNDRMERLASSETNLALMRGFVLGDRTRVSRALQNAFKRTGTVHLLAISGLHVALIASLFYLTLRFLRLRKRLCLVIAGLLLFAYLGVVGPRPSLLRATILSGAFLVSTVLERRHNFMNGLGLAAFISLLANPAWLFNVGFQLSYAAAFGIVHLLPAVNRSRWRRRRLHRWIIVPLWVSFSALAFTAPIVINSFGRLPLLAVPANVVLVPLLWLVLAELEVALILSFLWFPLALPFGAIANVGLEGIVHVVNFLNGIPFASIQVQSLPLIGILLVYAILLLIPALHRTIFPLDRIANSR